VAAYFLTLQEAELSFESALQIVKKEFNEQGSFIREDICFLGTENNSIKEKCIGCNKNKIVYGNDMIKFCAQCILPKNIYQKYLEPLDSRQISSSYFKREDPELLDSLQQQISLLTKK
jgi:hypothetical protein